jgi:hypothetical protein
MSAKTTGCPDPWFEFTQSKTQVCFKISCALAHKEKCGNMALRRAKDGESSADFSRAQGKGFLTPAAPRNDQRIPRRSSLPEFLNN